MHQRLRRAAAWLITIFLLLTPSLARANDAELRQALAPHVPHLKLKPDQWRALVELQVITRELSGSHAKEMASFGALIIEASAAEIVTAFRTLAAFKQSQTTLACVRFNQNPALDDLAGLKLKDKDALALMRAKVKESDIKLSAADIARLQAVAGPQPGFSQQLINKLGANVIGPESVAGAVQLTVQVAAPPCPANVPAVLCCAYWRCRRASALTCVAVSTLCHEPARRPALLSDVS